MDKSAPPQRRLLAVLALLATAGLAHAAPAPEELLRDALSARAAGRTAEAVRLLTELKALTPGDKRIETLLASLAPAPASKSEISNLKSEIASPPQGAAVSASPTESPKAQPDSNLLSEAKSRPSWDSEIKNQESQIKNRSSLLQAALAAQADGKPEQALAYLRELQALSPDDPRISSVVSALTPQGATALAAVPNPSQGAANSTSPSNPSEVQPDSLPINQESQIKNQESAYYSLPESIVLGVVTWVDPQNKQAVVSLYGSWKPDRLYLLSRDASFEASAILETSPFHNSRAIGVRAIEGMPQLGQEVIAPGPSVLKRIQDILGPRFRGAPPAPVVKTPDPAAPVETAAPSGAGTVDPALKPF